MNKYKLIFPLLISVPAFFIGCTSLHYRYYSKTPGKLPDSSKIALIGFHPFKVGSISSSRSGRTTTTTTTVVVDPENSLKSLLKVGKPAESFPVKGIRYDLKEETVRAFMEDYISLVKKSGIDELAYLIDAQKIDEKKSKLQFKNIDADYYLVGALLPPFQKTASDSGIGSVFLHFISYGIFPVERYFRSESKFYLYDRNLKMLKKFEYDGVYSYYSAYWATQDADCTWLFCASKSTPPSKVFESDVKQAEVEAVDFLLNKK